MSESTAARLGDEKLVYLTTFKRNGDAAASPMWIVRDGNQLLAWTPPDAWKVKRIRRDPRVTLRPCGRTGKVRAEQPVLAGTGEVITDQLQVPKLRGGFYFKMAVDGGSATKIGNLLRRRSRSGARGCLSTVGPPASSRRFARLAPRSPKSKQGE
jgi:PPOX class probable F420-dependent enzyme